jgi:hypothetical protein
MTGNLSKDLLFLYFIIYVHMNSASHLNALCETFVIFWCVFVFVFCIFMTSLHPVVILINFWIHPALMYMLSFARDLKEHTLSYRVLWFQVLHFIYWFYSQLMFLLKCKLAFKEWDIDGDSKLVIETGLPTEPY